MEYQEEVKHNESTILEALRLVYPELHILATQLRISEVNPEPIAYVIKHMAEIARDTGYGQVTIDIADGKVTILRGIHQTKLNQDVLSKN